MKSLLKPMLLALTLLAGAGSAKADGEVWIKTLPDDLKKGDKVVIVDLTTKMALANNCAEDAAPPSASIKLNDRNDRIAEETVGDTVRWTVGVEGSGDKRKLQFKTDDNRYLNALNKDNGLRIGGDGVKNFSTVYDEGNHRAWFLYTVVNDTARVMGMYSMLGIMNNWRIKTTIDDQIKGTVLAFFRKSDPSKSDVILSFVNADGEEDYNYETDLKNGANNFKAPTLNGLPSGAKVTYISTNEHVATVNASTGAITLLRRGTTDITVVYKGDSKNNYALATYTLRVDDGNETSGTSDHPFTVAEAIQYAKDGHGSAGYNYFVKGIVCKVESSNKGAYGGVSIPGLTDNSVEGTLTYWLSDSGVMKDSLKVSTGRGLNWSDLTTDSIAVGDEVLVVGPMSYSTGSNMMGMGTGTGTGTGTGGGKSKNGPVAVIDADNCMQSLFRKLLVDDTKLYLGTHRDGTELYRINGDVPGILGETTMSVKDTTVAKVTDDGWLVTQGVGKTVVTLGVPVTVPEGTYTMTRSFHLKVTTTDALEGHFVLVEDASTLQAGDSLLVVGTINDKSYVISSDDATLGGKKAIEVRIGENGTIDEVPDDATSVTLRGTAGAWNLNTRRNYYFYTSSKKPGAKSLSIPGMGEGTGTGTGTGTETDTEEDSEEGSGGTMPDFMSLFNGTGANKLRHDSIPGEVGDSAQVKIAINADALATITFRGDSILRYTEEVDLAGLLGGLGSFGGSDDSGSSTSSFDPSVLEGLNISMPGFEVFSPDTVPGVLPKLYRFEQTEGETRYDYYVAELNENDNVLTFKGTNTAPDGVTTWDAINTPDDTYPAWLRNSSGRPRRFYTVVFDETFVAARPKCCRRWFNSSQIQSYVGLQNLNTSEVTNMYGMFMNNNHLSGTLDLGHFKTSKVTNMEAMFYNCGELRTIYVGNGWDISNVTQSEDIFYASRSLVGQYGATYNDGHDISHANFDQPDGLLCFNGLIIKDDEDNSEALERYNGQTMNVYYDRVLKADKNEDGTWTSKAYSVCLPYDLDLTELREADKVQTCLLYYIKDNKEFLFSNCSPKLKAGLGYLIVAKEGSVRLGADNVTVTNQLYEGGVPIYPYEDANADPVGTWMGTLKKIESADAAAMYGFGLWMSGGKPYFIRVRPDTPNSWIGNFRAMYVPNEPTDIRYYSLSFKQWVAGGEDDPIVDFPSGDFDADEFPDGTVGIDTPIISIDSDKHRYFDLQGRQLSAPAAKGVYIDNGKKVIK